MFPIKLLKWKNTSWSCSNVSINPKLSCNEKQGLESFSLQQENNQKETHLQNSNETLMHLELLVFVPTCILWLWLLSLRRRRNRLGLDRLLDGLGQHLLRQQFGTVQCQWTIIIDSSVQDLRYWWCLLRIDRSLLGIGQLLWYQSLQL